MGGKLPVKVISIQADQIAIIFIIIIDGIFGLFNGFLTLLEVPIVGGDVSGQVLQGHLEGAAGGQLECVLTVFLIVVNRSPNAIKRED